jgi:hypothetical protein
MSTNDTLRASYGAVLADLQARRQNLQTQVAELQRQLRELQQGIVAVSKSISPNTPFSPAPSHAKNQKYATMSLRWAILDFLIDSEPLTTPEIAEALKERGVTTKATNFANTVSAVLSSTMKEKHSEVQLLPDGKWQLNENGKNAIAHIRTTPKFRRSLSSF